MKELEDIFTPNGNFDCEINFDAVSPQTIARGLAYKSLGRTDRWSKSFALLRLFGMDMPPVKGAGARAFLANICEQIGIMPVEVENVGLRWAADVVTSTEQSDEISEPSANIIKSTGDFLLTQGEICDDINNLRRVNRRRDRLYKLFCYGVYPIVFLSGILLLRSTAIPLIGGCITGMLVPGAITFRNIFDNQNRLHRLENLARPHIAAAWIDAAKEHGVGTISLADRLYDYINVPEPEKCSLQADIKSILALYSKVLRKIADVSAVSLDERLKLVDEAIGKKLPDYFRGLAIEVTSQNPDLAGTRLRLVACGPERNTNINPPNSGGYFTKRFGKGKRRERDKAKQWNWLPQLT